MDFLLSRKQAVLSSQGLWDELGRNLIKNWWIYSAPHRTHLEPFLKTAQWAQGFIRLYWVPAVTTAPAFREAWERAGHCGYCPLLGEQEKDLCNNETQNFQLPIPGPSTPSYPKTDREKKSSGPAESIINHVRRVLRGRVQDPRETTSVHGSVQIGQPMYLGDRTRGGWLSTDWRKCHSNSAQPLCVNFAFSSYIHHTMGSFWYGSRDLLAGEVGQRDVTRFCGLLWGKGVLVSVTCLGKWRKDTRG